MHNQSYLDFNTAMRNRFGGKVYRLALSFAVTCPNRDGHCGTGGCIFCSEGGSGEFAAGYGQMQPSHEITRVPVSMPQVYKQIAIAKDKVASKIEAAKIRGDFAGYIAYFQSFTNTYYRNEDELMKMEQVFTEAINYPEVIALSIATRPDCIDDKILAMLDRLRKIKPVWVELGLQTSNDETAGIINRCYETRIYDEAVKKLHEIGIEVITHMMVGLPGEELLDMKKTVEHIANLAKPGDGIKISLLYILKHTRLAEVLGYEENIRPDDKADLCKADKLSKVSVTNYTLEQYGNILQELIKIIPGDMVVHRITGDPPKKLIISPMWTTDKKKVLNYLHSVL